MLKQSFRLRSSTDFNKTYKFGRSTNAATLYIKALQTRQPISRCAVVVSKKVAKKATDRNKIKRRVAEIVRVNWDKITPGYNLIISLKQDIATLDQSKLEHEVLECLKRAGVVR